MTDALSAGAQHLRAGEFTLAIRAFESVLAADPDHADALQLIGLALFRDGRATEGLRAIERALEIDPDYPPVLANHAMVCAALGQLDAAQRSLEHALSLRPDFPAARTRLARLLLQRGNAARSAEEARRAVEARPTLEAVHILGVAEHANGNWTAAIEALQAVLQAQPQAPLHAMLGDAWLQLDQPERAEALLGARHQQAPDDLEVGLLLQRARTALGDRHGALTTARALVRSLPESGAALNALGAALIRCGEHEEALRVLRDAVAGTPDDPDALHNLADTVLRVTGDAEEAFHLRLAALRSAPGRSALWIGWVDALSSLPEVPEDIGVELEQCLDRSDVDHQRIEHVVRAHLERDKDLAKSIAALRRDATAPITPVIQSLLARPLVRKWLSRTLVRDIGWERALKGLRNAYLCGGREGSAETASVLALQAFYTEHVWGSTPAEEHAAEALLEGLEASDDPIRDAALASTVGTIPHGLDLTATTPMARRFVREVIDNPRREAALSSTIETAGLTDDQVSLAVRAQYEASPYPRLVGQHRKPPAPLHALVERLFPHVSLGVTPRPTRILIAGCGTGQQLLAAAQRYAHSEVVAVDLSRNSLAAAARRVRDWGLQDRVRLLHADLLTLETLGETFDLVEAGGVLHHMSDPLQGWRVLVSCTRPGGLMKIGLYSERGRADVIAARALAREHGWEPTPPAIRTAREVIAALPDGEAARRLLISPDFYSISGCRDLFMHTCEHRFTLPQIAAHLETLSLSFLGFQHADPRVRNAFAARGSRPDDLEAWERFEDEHPSLFSGMYQFWCQRP